jgi:hypothetical protein
MSSIHYEKIKRKWDSEIKKNLPAKTSSSKLLGYYFQPFPNELNDALPFYLFRKHTRFQYPILYFHPTTRSIEPAFLKAFNVTPVPLDDEWFASKIGCNRFTASEQFYDVLKRHVPEAEFYVLFQSDSFLLRDGLEEYMEKPWDSIGAVWEKGFLPGGICEPYEPNEFVKDASLHSKLKLNRVGNGGFSLRRISAFRKVAQSFKLSQMNFEIEDVFYSMLGQLTGMRYAPIDEARRFSWEDPVAVKHYVQELKISQPLAFHNLPEDMADLLIGTAMA